MKKKLVVFTGAGVSQESGIPTFRDDNGLWENYKIEDVATRKNRGAKIKRRRLWCMALEFLLFLKVLSAIKVETTLT